MKGLTSTTSKSVHLEIAEAQPFSASAGNMVQLSMKAQIHTNTHVQRSNSSADAELESPQASQKAPFTTFP